MKRVLSGLFLFSLFLSACGTNSTSVPAGSTTQPVEDTPTLAPYADDTPSPPRLDLPVVESPLLTSIQFLNSLDGWGLTETQIVRTNDSGFTWYEVTPPGITEAGFSVDMFVLDNAHVWIHIPDFDSYPNSGFLYQTSDSGLTWTSSSTPFSRGRFQFLDQANGWVLADLGVGAGSNAVAVFQTTDGGLSWTQSYTNDPNSVNASDTLPLGGLKAGITSINIQTAWVYGVTYSSGTVYLFRTDDAGASWTPVNVPLPAGAEEFELSIDPGQMAFTSSSDGFIAVRFTGSIYQTAVYVTHDAGNTWTLTTTPIPDSGPADFLSANEAVVYNRNQLYVTRDAANSWSIVSPDVSFGDTFAMMDFVNTSTGWVIAIDPATNQRSLYRTGDGGATWFPLVP